MQFDVSLLSLLSGECAAALSGTAAGQEISAQIALAPAAGAMSASVSVGGAALSFTGVSVAMMLVYLGLLKVMRVKELSEFVAPTVARLRGVIRSHG